ncbi:hypothetical protein [Nocardia pseudobrasiliensis]|uniref:hypothetical protein n=1 Tax=Nocardia pseudobrasiliensis TaxID=45979 RepID=UPI000830C35F|nr:hypothetical protein [Nocardia pseudobrasiliensis]
MSSADNPQVDQVVHMTSADHIAAASRCLVYSQTEGEYLVQVGIFHAVMAIAKKDSSPNN